MTIISTMNELTELRDFFDAHQEMNAAVDEQKFARAAVKANRAEPNLLALRRARIAEAA